MSKFHLVPTSMMLTAVSASLAFNAVAEDKLTVVSWGGAFTKSQVEAYHKPFIASTGTTIVSEDFSGGLAEIKAQVEANNVRWDLVSLDKPDIVRGCAEGLLEPFDPSMLPKGEDGTPAEKDFIDGAIHECAVNTIVVSTILAVNQEAFKGKAMPSKLVDLFDLENFPGRRALQKQPQGNLEWALLADGVEPETFTSCWRLRKAALVHLPSSTPSKSKCFGGRRGRNHRKCWRTKKS